MTEPTQTPEAKAPEVAQKPAAFQPKPGMYKNIRGQAIINAAGNKLKQTNGYFTPVTEEEKSLCKYFEGKGYLVAVK